jgi:dolichol kinase
MRRYEFARQLWHIGVGVITLAVLSLFFVTLNEKWLAASQAFFLIVLVVFLTAIFLKNMRIWTPLHSLFDTVGARDVFPGEGALWYILSILLVLSFLHRFSHIAVAIFVLAVGDSISSIFASRGRQTWPLKGRTVASLALFIAFSLPVALLLIGLKAIPMVLICAVAESVDLKINDNFLIPLVCVLFLIA